MRLRRVILALLAGYKRWISPLLPAVCRFHPSCSEYALEAIEVHGVWRGLGLAIGRLLRCQPWCRGGFDPVPPFSRRRRDRETGAALH